MDSPMSPREIQARIRAGASLAEVIAASGLSADKVEVFAGPIIAERDHTTAEALAAPVRRKGETASARRLSQTVAEALLAQGQDIDLVTWDSWRRSDGRWLLQGSWVYDHTDHVAAFVFDSKGRFSLADNDQARLLIGDSPLQRTGSDEPTVGLPKRAGGDGTDLSEETTLDLTPDPEPEDSLRSDIDMLYSMISTIDEDSVRIFRGLRSPVDVPTPVAQPSLIEAPALPPLAHPPAEPVEPDSTSTSKRKRKRASVPSWDDIMFGGQS